MNKVGLVIQGPLISFGRSGKTAALKLDLLTGKEGLVRYDCRNNIQKIIDDFGSLFSGVVVSTWDSELKQGDEWKGAAIVSMQDPGGVMDSSPRAYKAHNRNRQFIGIQQGVSWLKERTDAEYVVRMRTDQYVNLRALLESFERQKGKGILRVPFMRPGIFLASDFYMASSIQVLDAFLQAQLSYNAYEFIVDVHRDMVLKYAYASFRDEIRVPEWAYFPRDPAAGIGMQTKTIFDFMFSRVLFPLSEETLRSVVWRGSLLSEDYRKGVITEEQLSLKQYAVFPIPSIFSINWERYYEFCRTHSWKEPCVILFGEIGWRAWILLQHGMRKMKRIFV